MPLPFLLPLAFCPLPLPLALSVATLRRTVALHSLLPVVLGTTRLLTGLLARRARIAPRLRAARLPFTLGTTARGTLLNPRAATGLAASLAALLLRAPLPFGLAAGAVLAALLLLLARLLSRLPLVGIVLLPAFSTPLLLALLRFALLLTLLRIRLPLRRRLFAILVATIALWAVLFSIL